METRFSKRAVNVAGMEDKEGNKEDVHFVDDAIASEGLHVDEVPVGPKRKKTGKYSPRKLLSPTGMLELSKLKEQTKIDRQKIEHLENCIKYLEEANSELKNDKEFLLSQIKEAPPRAPASTGKSGFRKTTHIPSSSSPSMSPSPSSSSSDSSSSSSSEEEQKKKKKKKKEKKKSKKYTDSHSRSRMTTMEGIIRRYKNALKRFTKFGSMKKAFAKINVDRNTIARTAVIAELSITYPDTFKELLPTDDVNEKVSEFAERCRRAITKEMSETITAKKKSGQLLPIMHKYT